MGNMSLLLILWMGRATLMPMFQLAPFLQSGKGNLQSERNQLKRIFNKREMNASPLDTASMAHLALW